MQLVRLTSGEEIIGQVEESEHTIAISEAYSMVSTEPGKIGFIPFMAYAKDERIVIQRQFVMMILEPVDELVDQIRSMRSCIVTPPKLGFIV